MFAALVGACVRLLPFLSSLCSQDAGLVGACVPRLPFCLGCRVGGAWVLSYRFSQCLCSLVAVLVGDGVDEQVRVVLDVVVAPHLRHVRRDLIGCEDGLFNA